MLRIVYPRSCSVPLLAALLSSFAVLVIAFEHNLGKGFHNNHRIQTTTLSFFSKDVNTEPFSSLPTPEQLHPNLGNPSCESNLFRAMANDNEHTTASSWWRSFLLTTAVVLSMASNEPPPAHASLDISSGTTVFETSPELTQRKFFRSTKDTALKVAQTAFVDRNDLYQSLKRLQSAASAEFTSTQAWQEVWSIIQMYGLDLKKEITIRPPVDVRQTLKDLVKERKVNFIINGEVVQVSLEYNSGKDGVDATKTQKGDSSKESKDGATVVTPDDEWVLKVQGYRGFDPTAIDVALQTSKYGTRPPLWAQNFFEYYKTPYPEKYLSDFLIPTKEGQRSVTYGDILVLEGTLAVGFLYAWAYAYYLEEMEEAKKVTKGKTGVKQKVGGTKKEANVLAATKKKSAEKKSNEAKKVEEINEQAETVKVSIDFDSTGQMVITATENKSRDGVFALLQALYFPWLGMLVPSLTAPETVVISSSDKEETEGLFPFLRALYVPWLGILQGK